MLETWTNNFERGRGRGCVLYLTDFLAAAIFEKEKMIGDVSTILQLVVVVLLDP